MFLVDRLLLVAAVLVIVGILSSKFSARIGLPVLVLFVGVGMLAGSDGIGRIEFTNWEVAHGIGTIALAIILFDGGLRTALTSFRLALRPALSLATVGVFLTAGITGAAAAWLLDLPLLAGFLLGSIISSTDAAAVFNVLRSSGVHIRKRLAAVLEVESGSNDPMAVFLTIACLQLLLGERELGIGLLGLFVLQMGVGSITGFAVGKLALHGINRVNLQAAGLYPIITASAGLFAFGIASVLGGSGFLAVYLAGVVIGNAELAFKRGTLLFMDAAAWLSQIGMFVMLGLLAFPGRLIAVTAEGVFVAIVLIFIARPVAVAISLAPFRMGWRDQTFIAWVGLKGAVPIVLATYPLMLGLPDADVLFDIIFFAVLLSAVTQGWTIPVLAKRLHLQLPPQPKPPVTLEITSIQDVDADILEYTLHESSRAVHRRLRDLRLPERAVIALIARGDRIIPPRGSTELLPGDHVFVVLKPRIRPLVDRMFSSSSRTEPITPDATEFPLDAATTTLADLAEFYDTELDGDPESTLAEFLEHALGSAPDLGTLYEAGDITLHVLSLADDQVDCVGLRVTNRSRARPSPDERAAPETLV
ncbi:MAG TPA: potassium/proton antiporter [Longimicrobiales bacterium]